MNVDDWMAQALALDREDPLSSFRDRFHMPRHVDGSEVIYLVGNSLGLQPRSTRAYIERELEQWEELGVAGHFAGEHAWMRYHELVRDPMARLVGGLPHEVVVMNSLTVNLHLMMATFYRPSGTRKAIVIEEHAFPSDRYAVASQLRLRGLDPADELIELKSRPGEDAIRTADVVDLLNERADEIALILLGGVNYYTGEVLDMEAIARAARALRIPAGFDLAHAAGNIPLHLHDWNVDFAAWCTYKYLNAGPGGIAGCFIHERHARDRSVPRLAGWWGHDPSTRFEMPNTFNPIDSADGWQLSNPPILLLAALRASLDLFEEAGMPRLHAKSERLSAFTRDVLSTLARPPDIVTPMARKAFGCQLSLRFNAGARALHQSLEEAGAHGDFREPDVIRIAPVPLYNSFTDVVRFGSILDTLST